MGTPEDANHVRSSVIGGIPRPEARGTERRGAGREVFGETIARSKRQSDLTGRRQVWQPRLGRDLSREDARQIAENVTGFFAILAEWSRAEMPVPANDTGKPATSDDGRCAMTAETIARALGGRKAGGGWERFRP